MLVTYCWRMFITQDLEGACWCWYYICIERERKKERGRKKRERLMSVCCDAVLVYLFYVLPNFPMIPGENSLFFPIFAGKNMVKPMVSSASPGSKHPSVGSPDLAATSLPPGERPSARDGGATGNRPTHQAADGHGESHQVPRWHVAKKDRISHELCPPVSSNLAC